jgi:glycerophosphoryl diester phosphodiesterase
MSAKYSYKPTVVGHRGALYKSLENTRHSVKLAVEHGAEQVEIDVFLLKCGELVVFHGTGSDAKPGGLLEYCGVEGSILDLTYEEARKLKFNPHFDEFGCGPKVIEELDTECYIPTLFEILSDAKELETIIKIELKGPNTAVPVLKLVESLDMVDNVHYSSFDHSQIKRIRELRPDRLPDGTHRYKTGALFNECPEDFIQKAKEVDASEVHLKYSTCTTERVKMIHDAGMDSMIWMRGPRGMLHDTKYLFDNVGNEDEEMYRAIMSTGVKGMIVNRPDILSRLLRSQ